MKTEIHLTDAQKAEIGFAYLCPRTAAFLAIGWWLIKNGVALAILIYLFVNYKS